MPQRFLRPGITNSARWNSVSFEAQSFYVRILTLVDDFGRCDGRAAVLWGQCFAVWNEQNPQKTIKLQQVAGLLQQLAADCAQLIDRYESDGKTVLQVTQWQERVREGSKSKWPARTESAATCCNLLLPPPTPSPTPLVVVPAPAADALSAFPEVLRTPEFQKIWDEWEAHRREIKKPLTPTSRQRQLEDLSSRGVKAAIAALKHTIFKGWQGIREPEPSERNGSTKEKPVWREVS